MQIITASIYFKLYKFQSSHHYSHTYFFYLDYSSESNFNGFVRELYAEYLPNIFVLIWF